MAALSVDTCVKKEVNMSMCPLRFAGIRNPDAPGMNVECQGNKCQWWMTDSLPGLTSTQVRQDCAIVFHARANAYRARALAEDIAGY